MLNSENSNSDNNWLFLRGLSRGKGHWGSFISTFQDSHPDARIECVDFPGNGERVSETSPLFIGDYVQDLRENCSYLKEKKKFKIVAVSLGAMVTVEWMHRYPHEIQKSFLICTSSARHSAFYQRLQAKNLPNFVHLLSAACPQDWENAILNITVNDPQNRDLNREAMIIYSQKYPVRKSNVLRQLWAASRYRFPFHAPGDVRLIGSYGDHLVAPACTLQLAKAWGLEAMMHSSAGHDLALDAPDWLIEQLL